VLVASPGCHCDDYGPVLAPCPVPNPTILGKDEAMHATTLHTQADLWQHGAATFAAVFMEGEMRSVPPIDALTGRATRRPSTPRR
jgi:hypothetical protein